MARSELKQRAKKGSGNTVLATLLGMALIATPLRDGFRGFFHPGTSGSLLAER